MWSSVEKAMQSRYWIGGSIGETEKHVQLLWWEGGMWVNCYVGIGRFASFGEQAALKKNMEGWDGYSWESLKGKTAQQT